jgi:hypothetical protein
LGLFLNQIPESANAGYFCFHEVTWLQEFGEGVLSLASVKSELVVHAQFDNIFLPVAGNRPSNHL